MARKSKYQIWQKKRKRIKYRIMQRNIGNHPRLVVYRSNANIYAQLVDDEKGITVLSPSSIDLYPRAKLRIARFTSLVSLNNICSI